MARYAVLRVQKVKSLSDLRRLNWHLERLRETRNADPERQHLNECLAGSGDAVADAQARLAVAPTIRSNAVLGIELVVSTSKEFFDEGTPQEQRQRREAWRDATMAWLHETFGADNVVTAILHRDETTPHIQAVVVPIDDRGRLNARHFIGGTRYRLSELQDSYALAMKPLGVERGARGSVADHEQIRKFYEWLKQSPEQALRDIANAVNIEPPPRVVPRPREYAEEVRKQVVAAITPHVEKMAKRIEYLSQRVEKLERQVRAYSEQREKTRETERAQTAHERTVNLDTVLEALGARPAQNHDGSRTWKLGGDTVEVKGERFHNRDRGGSGTGAVPLVEYHTGYNFREAVAWLRYALGPDTALSAGARHLRQMIEREPRPAFRAPEDDRRQWLGVRSHLVGERGLRPEYVDALHATGALYADQFGRAVFLQRDEHGLATGATLWSTADGGRNLGLVPGTQRDAAFFEITAGTANAEGRTTLVITDTPVEALSWLELYRGEHGPDHPPIRVIALDESETLPQAAIAETLHRGGVVRVATGNTPTGDRIWNRIHAQHQPDQYRAARVVRDRPAFTEWNSVLCDPKRGRSGPTRGDRSHGRAPHRDRVRGEDYGYEIG